MFLADIDKAANWFGLKKLAEQANGQYRLEHLHNGKIDRSSVIL